MKKAFVLGLTILLLAGLFTVACENNDNGLHWENDVRIIHLVSTESLDSQWCCPSWEMTEEKWAVYHANIAKSNPAWEEARPHFIKYTDDFNTVVWHAKDFGGVYIDINGIFNICVVGNRQPVKSDYLIYRQVWYTLKLLESILDGTSEVMDDYTIWMVGICEVCNSVNICLEDEKMIQPFIGYLKSKELYRPNILHFYVGENDIVPLSLSE